MDENNPLFDLCKIKIELLFLNENYSNYQNYENDLIFYMNKYLWKIKMNNLSKEENEKIQNEHFYYLEFYTKNLNIKSSNIPDTNLLSNTTDFYCNLLFIFDSKEQFNTKEDAINNLINLLSSRNTPKELSHLLIICDKNIDLSFLINILDKNSYDIIHIWEKNDIKKSHKSLENALKNIISKYRVNALNQKIDINIKDKETNNGNKAKKNLEILDAYIKIGNYHKSIQYLEELKESFKVPKELSLFSECHVLIKFLIDYNNKQFDIKENKNKIIYKEEIKKGFLDVIEEYKNLKQIYLMINAYLKMLYYLSIFNNIDMKQKINAIIMHLLNENIENEIKTNIIFLVYLNLSHIYYKINFKRKFFLLLYMAYKDYSNNYKKNDLYGNLSYIDLLIKNIEKYFFQDGSNYVQNYYNYNYDTFLEYSNIIKKSHYKPIKFIFEDENKKDEINADEDYLEKRPLHVSWIFKGYNQIFHHIVWKIIQKKIYKNLMKYYKSIKNYDKTILYCLELLQTSYNELPIDKQNELINTIQKKSNKVKYINFYNAVNIPVLLKIIPQSSDIKFDCLVSHSINKDDDLFIFNPWNQKNENNINYYWTVNSVQSIIFRLYNPLNIQISLSQVQLIYNIKNKKNENNNIFNYIPCNIIILPHQTMEYTFKFKLLIEEVFDIIGIEYFFNGVKIKQYIKNDGNGLLYRYKNLIENLYNSKIKDKISLNNIRIYPEIPLVKFIPLNNELIEDSPLTLFEFQNYTFNFDIFNLSDKPIKQINVSIYAYKKDDYKIILKEEILKDNKTYLLPNRRKKYSYDFIQKKSYLKIEFILYYIYDDENEPKDKNNINKKSVKPFLFFKKELNYRNLFTFLNPEINPIYTNINLKNILSLEKNYSKYYTSIISNQFYFTFSIKLLLFLQRKVTYEIFAFDKKQNKNTLLDKGKFIHKKDFKIFVDKSNKLSKTYIKWKINENKMEGIINCFDLIKNVFNKEIEQNFDFDIIKDIKKDYVELIYVIQNNTKISFYNMKIKILLYQEESNNVNLNISLQDDIFIDGQLIHMIKEIKPKEKISIAIKLYPKKGIIFNTTFLLIDQKLKVLYVPSFSINYK